jgi:phosphoribosylformylglycinamidine synthase
MASEEFNETSDAKRPNVQVGDPFLEKLLLEACLEAMQTGAVVGIQDMGAAGLTCSTCEMGGRGGVGVEIELDLVPQRETGMTAYEIMLSESQERMLLVAEKGREDEVFRIFQKWGLDAVTIGRVIAENQMRVLHHGLVVAEIPNPALTDEAPLYHRPMQRWEPPVPREKPNHIELGRTGDLTGDLMRLLSSPNLCSTRWIHEQYDSMVQTNTVEGPGAGDAAVIRIKGTDRGLAMALDGNSRWCWLDPRLGAMHAVAESARNVACTGATPVAATNCLNFGNPEKPQIMWQFAQVIDGITSACEELECPITGGNVSFYNETLGEGIYPTPVIGVVGIHGDINQVMRPHFRNAGSAVILLSGASVGDLADAEAEFGSSEFAKEIIESVWGFPPAIELEREAALQKCVLEVIRQGLVESAHDCSAGGLAVALAKCAFLNRVGARINLTSWGLPREFVLFGEDASRIIVTCVTENAGRLREIAVEYGVSAEVIGETLADTLEIAIDGATVVASPVFVLCDVWAHALKRALHVDTEEQLVPEIPQKS